jgi:6-phosphogluconolactonase
MLCKKVYDSRESASKALALSLAETLRRAIGEKGEASLVVSGGSSPVTLFHYLSDMELPWDKVTVVPSDERDVPLDHPDRNEAMIARELLRGKAARARLCSLLPADDLPDRFDAVVLGMGDDGHTASLFPDSPEIKNAMKTKADTFRLYVPSKNMERVTLTPRALLRSGRIDLLFFGPDKREVFQWACEGKKVRAMPVRFVLQQDAVPVGVYWAH